MSDLGAIKFILQNANITFTESKTHASQGGFRTTLSIKGAVTPGTIMISFSHEDKLVEMNTITDTTTPERCEPGECSPRLVDELSDSDYSTCIHCGQPVDMRS